MDRQCGPPITLGSQSREDLLTSSRPRMTRIPTATRRQRVQVRASQTGPKLPVCTRGHAMACAVPRASMLKTCVG